MVRGRDPDEEEKDFGVEGERTGKKALFYSVSHKKSSIGTSSSRGQYAIMSLNGNTKVYTSDNVYIKVGHP